MAGRGGRRRSSGGYCLRRGASRRSWLAGYGWPRRPPRAVSTFRSSWWKMGRAGWSPAGRRSLTGNRRCLRALDPTRQRLANALAAVAGQANLGEMLAALGRRAGGERARVVILTVGDSELAAQTGASDGVVTPEIGHEYQWAGHKHQSRVVRCEGVHLVLREVRAQDARHGKSPPNLPGPANVNDEELSAVPLNRPRQWVYDRWPHENQMAGRRT